MILATDRNCNGCTACCEGTLWGSALGYNFSRGRPCHYVNIGVGCTVYENRPETPCQVFSCGWLAFADFPVWLKPSESGVIIQPCHTAGGIPFYSIWETKETISAVVLNWFINFMMEKRENISISVAGGWNHYGSPEFVEDITKNGVKY